MTDFRHVAVVDIGKTNLKLALVDLPAGREVDVREARNPLGAREPYPHHDVDAIWRFVLANLANLQTEHDIDAVSVTTHGATAAVIDADGQLVLPILDYEFDGPDQLRGEYDRVRPNFGETGSPPLPLGLNLGAQLFWLSRTFPDHFGNIADVLTYPQYWAFRLTGERANEVTSLGCHTDLWSPSRASYSTLVDRLGWQDRFAPTRPASSQLGPTLASVAHATGLAPDTPVFCGIHDSNASLLPHLIAHKPPFSVVSTGTWVVAMAIGGKAVSLDQYRDTLINVNAFGDPVPSARFMGGREYECLTDNFKTAQPSSGEVDQALREQIMILPAVQPGSGPFPHSQSNWPGAKPIVDGVAIAASSLYLALMTATCLDLIGAQGPIIVEGPFAENTLYLQMLAVATDRPVLTSDMTATGTSIGAAMLAGSPRSFAALGQISMPADAGLWKLYADRWTDQAASSWAPA